MSAEENKALAKRFFDEVCNGKKLQVADELFSVGHTYADPAIPGIPPGPAGQKQLIGTYQAAFPDARWEVEEMFAAGDKVVTRWAGSGTHKAALQGNPSIPPTGKKVRVTGVWIHRISSGKIVETWNHWDMMGMLQQLGVIPSPQ
jgi:steroid delta-isomerase-like uncharacterized protein